MNTTNSETCLDCGERAIAGLIFHELFCYDVYVVSAPAPQNTKQKQIDVYMAEKIVQHLEQHGFKCYHGSRDISGGEFVIQSLSKPVTIIPITIVPVYKDRSFTAFWNFLLRPDYLDRIVFLSFDSTHIEPPAVAKNSFSIAINDPYLLPKLIQTIEKKKKQIPLHHRKRKLEMGTDPDNSISSIASDFHRNIPFRRSNISRISFRVKPSSISAASDDGAVSLESASKLTSCSDLLNYCHNYNKNIRHRAANRLTKLIQKDIIDFTKNDDLHNFEKQVRYLVEKQNSKYFEKLYFWISAAIFFRIYKYIDMKLKMYMKSVTLTKCKIRDKSYDQLCQASYRKCTLSLHAKMKTWPSKLDNNDVYIRKFEDSLSMIDSKSSDIATTPPHALIKNITNLPWDIKHIFIAAIAEKLFQKKYTESNVFFFSQICATVGNKHSEVFLDVLERVTEYILENYTEGALNACLQLFNKIFIWKLRRKRRKYDKLNIIFKHILSKLVYHPVYTVRYYVTPLLFSEDLNTVNVSQLGNGFFKVNEELVEICIREHLNHNHPDLIVHDQVQTTCPHSLIFEGKTPESDVLVYVFKQLTINDVLQTNSTDNVYESFQNMSTVVKACQGHENIVALRNEPTNGVLPFYVVEHGKPLLQFLHEKENQLTLLQMIEILINMTKAVHHCHSKNIILCDITPASFIIVHKDNGSFQIKLASFLYAKCTVPEESNTNVLEYIDDLNFLCYQGDSKEDVAAHFSAPETLINKTFSKYSEVWMLAATCYSVLLYGRSPFQELAHLNVSDLVNEMTTGHAASIPSPFPSDLWTILITNLNFEVEKRMLTETLLNELGTYKNNLENPDTLYTVRTVCRYINPEDILRGHVDSNGKFVPEAKKEPLEDTLEDTLWSMDSLVLGNQVTETVSVRMSLNTRRKILQLCHENILKVAKIKTDCYKTTLISVAFDGHFYTLSESQDIGTDQLLSYVKQITFALQYLHDRNILHCDMRCSHIYVIPDKGTMKLGNFGRAVSLEGRQTFPYVIKMMPADAGQWSAPEVRANGMYSQASDIFNLAAVLWELLSKHTNLIYENHPLELFQNCSKPMEYYAKCIIPNTWGDFFNKLVRCIQKCWNPNPTKRPTLDVIIDIIKQIKTPNEQISSTSEEIVCDDTEDEEEDEYVYETVLEQSSSDFSRNYVWRKVVNELVISQGIMNDPTPFFEVIEMSSYDEVALPLKNKTRTSTSILL